MLFVMRIVHHRVMVKLVARLTYGGGVRSCVLLFPYSIYSEYLPAIMSVRMSFSFNLRSFIEDKIE